MRKRGHWIFAAGYDRSMQAMERQVLGARRRRLLSGLTGDVLDVGAGTGVNLQHYRAASKVVAVEPDPAMRARLTRRVAALSGPAASEPTTPAASTPAPSTPPATPAPAASTPVGTPADSFGRIPVDVHDAAAESLPFPDGSFDAVVCTLVLCTVADPSRALSEAARVLRPGGRLVVLEHVRGTGRLARWQDRITPLFSRMAGGCHPNRDTRAAIEKAGFTFEHVEAFQPLPGWVPTSPMLEAVAIPPST